MQFEQYPFEKLNELLENNPTLCELDAINLTIGEPQFQTPHFIQEEFIKSTPLLNKYPKTAGESELKLAMLGFIQRRFGITLEVDELIPTFGTREVLFNFPQFFLSEFENPQMACPNPFYQIYEGAAIASKAKLHFLHLNDENGFRPDPNDARLKDCNLVIINTPNNPTASVLSLKELQEWVRSAIENDFVLLSDECYSEIYFDEKPHSLLDAAHSVGNTKLKNILVVNSLSKRSSAPGLRSGFIAGDKTILKKYMQYRTYVGAASPLPLQRAATIAWSYDDHVEDSRKVYEQNMKLARSILGITPPEATFYIWLKVNDDLEFTKALYKNYNVKVLPGSFLGREGAGKGYVRIALVENPTKTRDALTRIKHTLDAMNG